MPKPQEAGCQPLDSPDATLISSSTAEVPTHSSRGPLEHAAFGETKSAAPISTVIEIGSQLGTYQLVAKLGEGGMGAVYKARHTKLGKMVALKILPQHVMTRSDALARFEREMLAVGSLHHPNIVQALDAGEFGGVHYLSMEYVEGQDLQEFVKAKGPLSFVTACQALRQAAQGLAAAHKLGLVHRDIKPSNLFVTRETGQIKILDLGLALLSHEEGPAALTSTGHCFGTPDYMAPEHWNDAHTCDARADLYSMGCTLYFLLVGHPQYHSDTHRTVANKMKGHVIDPIPDLRKERRDVPSGLAAIYERLMAKRPEDRFASADELASALVPFASNKGTETAAGDFPPQGDTLAWKPASPGAPSVRIVDSSPSGSSRKRLLAFSGAAALALLIVILLAIIGKDGTRTNMEAFATSKFEITTKELDAAPKTGWHGWPKDAPSPAIAPFNAEQAKQHQEAWAIYLGVPVEYINTIGMKFRLIPPGEFTMGSSPDTVNQAVAAHDLEYWRQALATEGPQRRVTLTRPFYLAVHETTVRAFQQLVSDTAYVTDPEREGGAFGDARGEWKRIPEAVWNGKRGFAQTPNHPVSAVSWNDAQEFCRWLSQENSGAYRLPSEAEWEYAAKAGIEGEWGYLAQVLPNGDSYKDVSWCLTDNVNHPQVVGGKQANAFGMHDLLGNLWEWCEDRFAADAYQATPATDPRGPATGDQRMKRGGDIKNTPRATERSPQPPQSPYMFDGFRVALSVDAVRQALKLAGPAMPRAEVATPSTPARDRN